VRLQNEIIALREEIYRHRCQGYDKDKLSRLLHEYSAASLFLIGLPLLY